MADMTSTKPYLFRGIFEWIEDNQMTPYIVVDANANGVLVPQDYVNDGQITLNISSSSIQLFAMDNKVLHFSARFNGLAQELTIPMHSILGVYARENGQGMFFEAEDYPNEQDSDVLAEKKTTQIEEVVSNNSSKEKSKKPVAKKDKKKSDANKKNSHLKIIK